MADRFLSDLIGTLRDYIRIGLSGFRLKNNSAVAEIRNYGDTAYANLGMHTLEVHGSNATNKVTLTAPAGLSGNVAFVLPSADGSPGQFVKTDGSGNFSFADSSSNGVLSTSEAFTEATSSPLTIFTPPANSTIVGVGVLVSSAAGGGSPTIEVGIAGDTDRDMDTLEVDLKTAGYYEVSPMTAVGGTPDAVITTITPNAQTFAGIVTVFYTTPA